WLPHSGGFVYTVTDWPGVGAGDPRTETGRLVYYDLAKKAPRVLTKAAAGTIRPALSPDGRRVVVARVAVVKQQPPTVQVRVWDLDGKETHTSPVFAWGEVPPGEVADEKYARLFWAPRADKVLVYANRATGIYDLHKGQVVMLGAATPAAYGTTPIRPDGR